MIDHSYCITVSSLPKQVRYDYNLRLVEVAVRDKFYIQYRTTCDRSIDQQYSNHV